MSNRSIRTGRTNNREYKDSLFRMLFNNKEELLILYNAIRGTEYTNVEDLEVNTLEDVIYLSMKNDISFLIDGNLSLYEHQSTYNGNMPLRNLLYIANLYSGMTAHENLYGTKTISLPTPHFVVFYNGSKSLPERSYQKLSQAYTRPEEGNLELKVLILNINKGYNEDLMKKCKTLAEYVAYVDLVKRYSETMDMKEAIEQAIRDCINNDILAEFLRKHKSEVKHMNLFEYDAKEHIEMERKEAREEGYEDGCEDGRKQERILLIQGMLRENLSREVMQCVTGLEEKELDAILQEIEKL